MSVDISTNTRPTTCPVCTADLRDPRISMSRKAKRVRYIGMGMSPFWFLGAWWLAGLGYFDWINTMGENMKQNGGILLFFTPFLVGLLRSSTYPRVLPFECFGCGWKMEYELESE